MRGRDNCQHRQFIERWLITIARRKLHLEAAMRTNAVRPGETPVYSASKVSIKVEQADKVSKRYINQACRLLR